MPDKMFFFPTLPSTLCYLNRKESLTCRATDQISHGQAIAVAQVMHIWKQISHHHTKNLNLCFLTPIFPSFTTLENKETRKEKNIQYVSETHFFRHPQLRCRNSSFQYITSCLSVCQSARSSSSFFDQLVELLPSSESLLRSYGRTDGQTDVRVTQQQEQAS